MVGSGLAMLAVTFYALFLIWKRWPEKWTKWLKWLPMMIVLPWLANSSGWITTESGRQPWIVQGLLKVQDSVSPNLTNGMIWFSLIGFVILYTGLMIADSYLLLKFARINPDTVVVESDDHSLSINGSGY